MDNIIIIDAQEKFIKSYWHTFAEIAAERKYLGLTAGFPLNATISFITKCIQNNTPYLFVVDTKSQSVVGWCDVSPKESGIGCLGIGLAKEYRGKGLGKKLIHLALEKSKQYGYQYVDLEVRHTNEKAKRLYTAIGFAVTGITKNGLEMDGAKEDVIRMRIDLQKV